MVILSVTSATSAFGLSYRAPRGHPARPSATGPEFVSLVPELVHPRPLTRLLIARHGRRIPLSSLLRSGLFPFILGFVQVTPRTCFGLVFEKDRRGQRKQPVVFVEHVALFRLRALDVCVEALDEVSMGRFLEICAFQGEYLFLQRVEVFVMCFFLVDVVLELLLQLLVLVHFLVAHCGRILRGFQYWW